MALVLLFELRAAVKTAPSQDRRVLSPEPRRGSDGRRADGGALGQKDYLFTPGPCLCPLDPAGSSAEPSGKATGVSGGCHAAPPSMPRLAARWLRGSREAGPPCLPVLLAVAYRSDPRSGGGDAPMGDARSGSRLPRVNGGGPSDRDRRGGTGLGTHWSRPPRRARTVPAGPRLSDP